MISRKLKNEGKNFAALKEQRAKILEATQFIAMQGEFLGEVQFFSVQEVEKVRIS